MTVPPIPPEARDNDSLGTPQWILDRVDGLGPIALDPCSNPWSLVRARVALSKHRGEDGLALPWSEVAAPPGLVYCNPPYSDPLPWAVRMVEAADAGLEVVALLKLDPSTRWAHVIRRRRDARCDLHRRVRFEGGKYSGGALASTLAYMGPRPYLFAHLFHDVGEVAVYPKNNS